MSTQAQSIKIQHDIFMGFARRYLLHLSMLLGVIIRLFFVLSSPFPLNDGGMFYTMAQDLAANRFAIPTFTSYNSLSIPFTYPPFGIYITALIATIFNIPMIDVFRWLPLLVNMLTIPCYFLLCKTLLRSDWQVGLATLFFAILPRSYWWLIVGGGVTRAFGFLFAILAIHQMYWMYYQKEWKYILGATLFCGLTVLSHPEKAWFTVLSGGLLFLFYGLHWRGVLYSIAVVSGTILVALPWLLTVALLHNGLKPFENAFLTGGLLGTPLNFLLINTINGFREHTLLAAIGLIGIIKALMEKWFFLVIWLLVVTFGYPRAPHIFSAVPLAMLIALAVDRFIFPMIQALFSKWGKQNKPSDTVRQNRIAVVQLAILSVLIVYGIAASLATPIPTFTHHEADSMLWVAQHTPRDSRFLVLTNRYWFGDAVSEWFPVLTQRQSLATVQGIEWLSNARFENGKTKHEALQKCLADTSDCLEKWAQDSDVTFTHVYFSKPTIGETVLETMLKVSSGYELIYQGENAVIFAKRDIR